MKRYILIAAVYLAASITAWAQMPTKLGANSPEMSRQADPSQLQMIRNAEASHMKTYNDKNKPHLMPTDLGRLRDSRDLRAQEYYNSSVANTSEKAFQRATKAYEMASSKMKKALEKKFKAEKDFSALREKQMLEWTKLEQKQAKASANGLTASQRMKQETERTKLHKKHVNQRLKVQERYMNAVNTVNESQMILERAKVELEKYM